jgi:hypothetical protein
MGKGSKKAAPAQPTTQTVVNQTIPSYLQPYITDVAKRAQSLGTQSYTPYQGQRVAGFDPLQEQMQQGVAALTDPREYDAARAIYGRLADSQPTLFGDAQGYAAPDEYQIGDAYQLRQIGDTGVFNPEIAQFYMNPYQSAVSDIAARKAIEESQRQQIATNLGAAKMGTYGGGRQAVIDAMRQTGLTNTIGDIYAAGQQRAFENAQQQFERDRAAGLSGRQFDIGAAERAYQTNLGAQERAYQMNEAARLAAAQEDRAARERAYDLNQQARQFADQQQMAIASGLGALGSEQQNVALQRLNALEGIGAQRQAQQQAILDTRYQDFLRQRDYPMEQLGFYSNLIRGLPAPLSTTSLAYGQTPTAANQLAGLMGAGIGAYNAFSS